ncbi:hypothetical protein [Actinoalloteichus caeruleus]|uniref:hypothetical protein n=1 Tax=Actinoalloteichus cyanogriseus TaxID=2893586 RepID=UPI003AAE74E5
MAERIRKAGHAQRGEVERPHYRTIEHGTCVVVVPTRCPIGLHVLANVGYRIYGADQTLHIDCEACEACDAGHDHGWSLTINGQQAASAEFDDGPYIELLKNLARCQ